MPLACAVSALVFGFAPTVALAGTVVVTPSSMAGDGWAFVHRDSSGTPDSSANGTGQMVNGPGTPPLGSGSAQLATGNGTTNGNGDQDLRTTNYAGVALNSITALSYSTYDTANNGSQFPYLALDVNWSGGTTYNDRLFFEPPYQRPSTGKPGTLDQGATVMGAWQTWNALIGSWWANSGNTTDTTGCTPGSGACTLADYLLQHPATTIINAAGGLGGVEFKVGQAGATDVFNGYVDNFTFNSTTYDFEAAAAATPLPAALPLFASGLGAMGFIGWRRKRKALAA